MTRLTLALDAALRVIAEDARIHPDHRLVAPALLKSQVLTRLYAQVRAGELDEKESARRLDRLRALKIRLLSDRVSQRTAWRFAEQLDLPDTSDAEYLAVTSLQADALVTADPAFAKLARRVVEVVPFGALVEPGRTTA